MAASLSRPDPSSPASVAEASFSTTRRGFQQDEVRAFLVAVGAELGRLQERERQLESELRDALAAADAVPSKLDEATVTELLGEETVRVLQTARESASQIKIRAEETAARVLREANDEANRLRQETEVEVARRRQEAAADAEAEVALAKQQGREMVNEARAYRERVLADLDRRTTLARKQIEELIHGRDRLLQVFERARLVAVDVTSDLRDIDTPDELVNLTPTTGPVPIMVPSERRPRREVSDEAEATDDEGERPDEATVEADAGESPDGEQDADAAAERSADPGDEAATDDGAAADELETGDDTDDTDDTEHATTDDQAAESSDGDQAAVSSDDDHDVDDDHDDAATSTDASEPGAARDDNVVSLFRDRAAPASDDDDLAVDDGGAEYDADADEVDGIFARLRDELPTADTVVAEPATDADATTADHDEDDVDDAANDDDIDDDIDDHIDDDAGEETPFTRRDEVLVPLIVSGARKIKRVLADEQNLVLDRLRQKEPVAALDDLVPPGDEHAAAYRDAIDDELVGAAAAGAVEIGANDTRTLRNRLARAGALDDATALIRTALIGPLRDRLERSIVDGDGDNEAITKRVRAVYREWKTQHIDTQLDDVFRFAHGGGIAVTVEPGSPLVWTVDPAQPACPDCEDNSLSGAVPAGEPFPTGHTTAPAHPGCHCLVLPAE